MRKNTPRSSSFARKDPLQHLSIVDLKHRVDGQFNKNELIDEEIYIMKDYLSSASGANSCMCSTFFLLEWCSNVLFIVKYNTISVDGKDLFLPYTRKIQVIQRQLDNLRTLKMGLNKMRDLELQQKFAALEAYRQETKNLTKNMADFRKYIVHDAVSRRTGKILAERVENYLQNSLQGKSTRFLKLKQENKKLASIIAKLTKRLKKNTQVSETLNKIDFDQMKIENEQMRNKEKHLNSEIIRLKSTTGKTQQMLANLMNKLNQFTSSQKKLARRIRDREEKVRNLEIKIQKEEKMRSSYEKRNRYLVRHHEELRVPKVLEYVKIKSDHHLLQRKLANWTRKLAIADMNENMALNKWRSLKKVELRGR